MKISYWSKFHVNIITGSGVMIIFLFCKWLTRNPDIGKKLVSLLPNIWRLGDVRDTKFVTKFSNKKLVNAAKYKGYSLHCFWFIMGKPTKGQRLGLTDILMNKDPQMKFLYWNCVSEKASYWQKLGTNLSVLCNRSIFYSPFYLP